MANKTNLHIGDRQMLHNQVCSILRRAILKREFQPGERLIQAELAESIGVSRMPIREALRTLENEGLVTLEPHKGAVVRTPTKEDIQEIYELRAVLEPLALKHSLLIIDTHTRNEMNNVHISMLSTTSNEDYVELNSRFHQLLFQGCHKQRLMGFIDTISHGFALDTPLIIPDQIEKSNEEHAKIVVAINDKQYEQAEVALKQHIERTGQELLNYLDEYNTNHSLSKNN